MIPKNIAEVTSDGLSQVLGAGVRDFSARQIGQGIGLLGDIYRVQLQYSQPSADQPESVVVKLPSSAEENRQQGVALGMFEAEVRFYNELAPADADGLPRVFHARIDSGTADFVIVMEDLCDLSMVSQTQGMSAAQATNAVTVLAGLHAIWWDRVRGSEYEWIPTMVGPRIAFVDQYLAQIFPQFVSNFADDLTGEQLAVFRGFVGNYLTINEQLVHRTPWTLAHQDYRVDNLLFGPEASGQVVVIDWQGIGRGPGVYDLAYILGGSLSTDLRRAHEPELLNAYHAHLCKCGVINYELAALKEDYALAQLMGGLATSILTGGALDLSNERGRELVRTMATRHASAALDHGGLARLAQLGT